MFAHSKNVNISGGQFHVTYTSNTSEAAQKGIELLWKSFAPGALHNSDERYDPPKCHAHTREAILQEIMDWIEDMDRQTRLLWLYGPAGAGKSAIEQTIAELCYKMKLLAASFFFSRSAGDRNKKTFLITTIVQQLIVSIPEIREHVGNALYNDPTLPTLSLEAQMDTLIVKPLEAVASSSAADFDFMNSRPKVIVIDGLDECGDPESQRYILKVLMNAVNNHSIPFSFIIASRPEQHIREAFDGKLLSSITTRLVLDDKYHPDDDIRTFLRSRFQDIKDRHPSCAHLPPSWPTDQEVKGLVHKSSGQFIYASTVIKFIDSHRHWPPDRLDIIFGLSPRGKTTPFAEIDSLYLHILMSTSDNIETALEIFAVLLFLHHRDLHITPRFLESFLSLRPGEVFMVLSDLHSIISVPSPDEEHISLQLLHASLGDFLTDHSRSGDTFFLDSGVCHRNIVNKIIEQFSVKPAPGRITKLLMKPLPAVLNLIDLDHNINRQSLLAVFPELCLKATPDSEFLLNLYDFDMSLCPHRPSLARRSHITQIFMETFDAIHSSSRVPELFVWMQSQKHPRHWNNLFRHHLKSIDVWLRTELSAVKVYDHFDSTIALHVLASATLIEFPQFPNIHHLIPCVLDLRPRHLTEYHYRQIEDSGKWEIYVKYRHIVSRFLTDRSRSSSPIYNPAIHQPLTDFHVYDGDLPNKLFVGQRHYFDLAKYLLHLLSDDLCKIETYEVDIPKTVLILLPIVFSAARPAVKRLLAAGSFSFDPQLPRRFPQENWNELFSSCYSACKLAAGGANYNWIAIRSMITGPGGSSSRPTSLNTMSRFKVFKSSKS